MFYMFKLWCKQYKNVEGQRNLEAAFGESRRAAWDAVSQVNSRFYEENEGERYIFICGGNPTQFIMAAAFRKKEEGTVQAIRSRVKPVLEEAGGMQAFSISELHEITTRDFNKALQNADDENYINNCRRMMQELNLDYFDNNFFRFWEELPEGKIMTKAEAIRQAKEILADRSLLEELERIYSKENARRFYGHPVHYKIVAGSRDSAMEIIRLLTGALYSRDRLPSRRLGVIGEIKEGCYEEDDMKNLFRGAAGSTLVIELRGSNEEHGNYASAYERVVEFISNLVKKYHRGALCIFLENTDNPGFTASLMANVDDCIDVIGISEGAGNREQASDYLRRLVKEAEYKVMDEAEIREAVGEKFSFTSSELYRIYNKYYKIGLKNKVYKAYRAVELVPVKKERPSGDAYERLQKMVGLTEIKGLVDQIISSHKMQKIRSDMGLARQRSTMHMIFTGNPGSAKTTVARLLADILKKEGVLESGAYVECGRSDLVGKYLGWTAPTVKKKFKEARGGVLFIDEAYALVEDRDGLYGDEAIHTIVQEMENHRDDVLVIFAGYRDKMEGFLKKNEGLRSRIAFHLDFPDYNAAELSKIISLLAKDRGYELTTEVLEKCRGIFEAACGKADFGNGRFARNLLEQAILKQSSRIMGEAGKREVSREEMLTLQPEDFDVNIFRRYESKHAGIGFV